MKIRKKKGEIVPKVKETQEEEEEEEEESEEEIVEEDKQASEETAAKQSSGEEKGKKSGKKKKQKTENKYKYGVFSEAECSFKEKEAPAKGRRHKGLQAHGRRMSLAVSNGACSEIPFKIKHPK